LQKLKWFSSSTKFFVIGIAILARMAIVNNHVNNLHSLQDLNLVRSLFLHFFKCFLLQWNNEWFGNFISSFTSLFTIFLPLSKLFEFTSCSIMTKSMMSGTNCVCLLITHEGIGWNQPMNTSSNPQCTCTWGLKLLLC